MYMAGIRISNLPQYPSQIIESSTIVPAVSGDTTFKLPVSSFVVEPNFVVNTQTLLPGDIAAVTVSASPVTVGLFQLDFGIPPGDAGITPLVSATVTTSAPGTNATVTLGGTVDEPLFAFTIPRGSQGAIGTTPVVSATITTIPYTDPATVVKTGTDAMPTLNFRLPRGEQGLPGIGINFKGRRSTYDQLTSTPSPSAGDAWFVNFDRTFTPPGSSVFYTYGLNTSNVLTWLSGGALQGPAGAPGFAGSVTELSAVYGLTLGVTNYGNTSAAKILFTLPPAANITELSAVYGPVLNATNYGDVSAAKILFTLPPAATITELSAVSGISLNVTNYGNISAAKILFTIPPATQITGVSAVSGTSVSVTNVGSTSAYSLLFTLPPGVVGAVGAPGSAANIVELSAVYGSILSATNYGSASAAKILFTLPPAATINELSAVYGSTLNATNYGSVSAAKILFTLPPAATIEEVSAIPGVFGSDPIAINRGSVSAAKILFTLPPGLQGPIGLSGITPTISAIVASVAPFNSAASITTTYIGNDITRPLFNFTLPRGPQGSPGIGINFKGRRSTYDQLTSTPSPSAGDAWFVDFDRTFVPPGSSVFYTYGLNTSSVLTWLSGGALQGPAGVDGAAGTITSVSAVSSTSLGVVLGGTANAATLTFRIPPATQITGVSAVPGVSASVTNVGSPSAYNLLFALPTGPKGDEGRWSTPQVIKTIPTTTYTLTSTDAGALLIFTNTTTTPTVITVPANTTTSFLSGQKVDFVRTGTAELSCVGAAPVSVNGTPTPKLRAQYSAATLVNYGTNQWLVIGDLAL
jgi:hypothetical protein